VLNARGASCRQSIKSYVNVWHMLIVYIGVLSADNWELITRLMWTPTIPLIGTIFQLGLLNCGDAVNTTHGAYPHTFRFSLFLSKD
jgi:hypothetical protein